MNDFRRTAGARLIKVTDDEWLVYHVELNQGFPVASAAAQIFELCNNGAAVEEAAEALGMTSEEVEGHLLSLAEAGLGTNVWMPTPVEQLVRTKVGDETIVLNTETMKATNLGPEATLVFERCDGKTPLPKVGEEYAAKFGCKNGEEAVAATVGQLCDEGLVDLGSFRTGRREFLANAAKAAAIPVVLSVMAPHPAHAASPCNAGCTNACVVGNCGFCSDNPTCSGTVECANSSFTLNGANAFTAIAAGPASFAIAGTTQINDCLTACGMGAGNYLCCVNGPPALNSIAFTAFDCRYGACGPRTELCAVVAGVVCCANGACARPTGVGPCTNNAQCCSGVCNFGPSTCA